VIRLHCNGLAPFGYVSDECIKKAAAQFLVWPRCIPQQTGYAYLCAACLRRLADAEHHGPKGIYQVNRIDHLTGKDYPITLEDALQVS
jgi:hypothetical protein